MTVETAASNGMKISSTITDVLLTELAKTLRLRQMADRKMHDRIESLEESKDKMRKTLSEQGDTIVNTNSLLEEREKEVNDLLKQIKEMKNASPEDRDMASQMTGEFRKEYRAEVRSELKAAGFNAIDISDCFEPIAEDNDKVRSYIDSERNDMGASPYMRLYHFNNDEREREAICKIANLYNDYDESLMHKTHRVSESEFAIEGDGPAESRITTISGLRAEEALAASRLIERRSREADIIELAKQDPDLEPYYRERKIPEHVVGDYALEPTGKDANGRTLYSLTVNENDRDAAVIMIAESKMTLATPYAAPILDMYELEKGEMDKINKALMEGKEFTVTDINNASHILRVYKDGYSEISKDEKGEIIKKDYQVEDPADLRADVKNVMNTMAHPFHMEKKDIKPKDIVVNEEYQERVTQFAALEIKTDDAYTYSPKNFMRQFKVEITEEGGIKVDAPEHIQPPVIAVEDMERYRKNEKVREFIAQGLDPQEAKEVGNELDQIEYEKYSSYYHPEADEEKELNKEDKDSLLDIFASTMVGISVTSHFPERKKEEEHSLGSGLQQIITGKDASDNFADPGRDLGDE